MLNEIFLPKTYIKVLAHNFACSHELEQHVTYFGPTILKPFFLEIKNVEIKHQKWKDVRSRSKNPKK